MYESRNKLEKLCGFPNPHTTGDALITHLIEQTKNTVDDSFIKESTAKSLLLLAKWQEWKWSHNHIISRLLKVMEQVNFIVNDTGEIGISSNCNNDSNETALTIYL